MRHFSTMSPVKGQRRSPQQLTQPLYLLHKLSAHNFISFDSPDQLDLPASHLALSPWHFRHRGDSGFAPPRVWHLWNTCCHKFLNFWQVRGNSSGHHRARFSQFAQAFFKEEMSHAARKTGPCIALNKRRAIWRPKTNIYTHILNSAGATQTQRKTESLLIECSSTTGVVRMLLVWCGIITVNGANDWINTSRFITKLLSAHQSGFFLCF